MSSGTSELSPEGYMEEWAGEVPGRVMESGGAQRENEEISEIWQRGGEQ